MSLNNVLVDLSLHFLLLQELQLTNSQLIYKLNVKKRVKIINQIYYTVR